MKESSRASCWTTLAACCTGCGRWAWTTSSTVSAISPSTSQHSSRVVQHDARLLSFMDQLRNEFVHALVAPGEDPLVVAGFVVPEVPHKLEIADHRGGGQVVSAGRNQRLVHVEGIAECAPHAAKVDTGLAQVSGSRSRQALGDDLFRTANVRQPADILMQLDSSHRSSQPQDR